MVKVLVTGGAGFIGSHLVEAFLKYGIEVRVLDNFSLGQRKWVPLQAEIVEGDMLDENVCIKATLGIDAIIHLAAMSRVGPSINQMGLCVDQNIIGTKNILLAASVNNVNNLIYAASSSCYGNSIVPQSENTPVHFLNFYSLTKYSGEQLALTYGAENSIRVVSLRYFNVFGARQPSIGSYALVIGAFINKQKNGQPLEIHGDGNQRRDFIHVDDVVRANLAALNNKSISGVYNIGSGNNISVKEIADIISPNQIYVKRRPGDAENTLAKINKAQQELKWTPTVLFKDAINKLLAN